MHFGCLYAIFSPMTMSKDKEPLQSEIELSGKELSYAIYFLEIEFTLALQGAEDFSRVTGSAWVDDPRRLMEPITLERRHSKDDPFFRYRLTNAVGHFEDAVPGLRTKTLRVERVALGGLGGASFKESFTLETHQDGSGTFCGGSMVYEDPTGKRYTNNSTARSKIAAFIRSF